MPQAYAHKTRLAPTPTGYMHLGNVYSFALTAALAQQHNAAILLRIDDLDHQRVNNAYVQDIFDELQFLNIPWHEGPRNIQELEQQWGQQQRMHLYSQALQALQEQGLVFACNCSRTTVQHNSTEGIYTGDCRHKRLPFDTNAWRFNTPGTGTVAIKTGDGRFIQQALPANMQHFVVRKKDGHPSYQLASVIDDLFFNVDMIVRGADLWPSTIAQHYLAEKLQQPGFKNIIFYHHGLVLGQAGEKLSKSAGSTSIQYLRKQGHTAEDIYALVGRMCGLGDIKSWKDIDAALLEKHWLSV